MSDNKVGNWIESKTLELNEFCADIGHLKIPSYQRAYEWNAYNVQRLLTTIYDGVSDQTFLGAIQIAMEEDGSKYIVDGRQRLTTLALIYAVAVREMGLPFENPLLSLLEDEQLRQTIERIQGGTLELKELSSIGHRHDITRLNRNGKDEATKCETIYARNASYIFTALKAKRFDKLREEGREEVVKKMFRTIFFIVVTIIERDMSKVIRIFDTLNSTGQELSDEAMFKLRYHAYLRSHDEESHTSEEIMSEINKGYDMVRQYNKDTNKLIPVSMKDVLWGYRTYLLTFKEVHDKMGASDMTYGTLGFFEALFGKENEEEGSIGLEILSLEEFHRYIGFHLEFYRYAYPLEREVTFEIEEAINRIMSDLLGWSRYGGTWALPIAFFAASRRKGQGPDEAFNDASARAKLIFQALYYFSIIYDKGVKRIKTNFLFDAMKKGSIEETKNHCKLWIESDEKNRSTVYKPFWTNVRDNFYWDYGRAYSFLAVMELCKAVEKHQGFSSFVEAVYPWSKDTKRPQIEHIYCQKYFSDNKELTDEEKAKFNGLGNFVLLEEDINKSSLKGEKPSKKFNDEGFNPSADSSRGYFFPRSQFALVGELRKEYKGNCDKYGDLDNVRNWLEVIKSRYEDMKGQFIGLFPLLKEVK